MKVLFQNKTIVLTSSPYGALAGGLLICILYLVLLVFLAPALRLPLDSWAFLGLALPGLLVGVFFLRSITLAQSIRTEIQKDNSLIAIHYRSLFDKEHLVQINIPEVQGLGIQEGRNIFRRRLYRLGVVDAKGAFYWFEFYPSHQRQAVESLAGEIARLSGLQGPRTVAPGQRAKLNGR